MVEQWNRARSGVLGLFMNPIGATNCLSINGLWPLLGLRGRVPFSKGVSKGFSKGRLAARSQAAGVAMLDGYLIGGTGRLRGLRLTIATGVVR